MGTPSKSHTSDLLRLSQAIALLSACNTCQISDTKKASIKPAYIPTVNIYHPIKLRSIAPDITLNPIQESYKILFVELIVDQISK